MPPVSSITSPPDHTCSRQGMNPPGPRLLSELCRIIDKRGLSARLEGEDCLVKAVNTIDAAGAEEITFLSNPKYGSAVARCRAAAVIAKDQVELPRGLSVIRCDDPYGAVTVVISVIHGFRRHPEWGLSPQAWIHPTAQLGTNVQVAPWVTIGRDVRVGDGCVLYPGCYVGDGATLGRDCVLFPSVVIYDGSIIGDRATIHAGSVIGEDGLGYAPVDGHWIKIPQVGRVELGDDVEIGANCTVDRATLGCTAVGAGTKFGNVVVIGHGAKIGPDCLFVGLVGVAGSTTIGRHVTLAGQVGVAGHLSIGDDVSAGAQSGIASDVPSGSQVFGSPAINADEAKRSAIAAQRLPDLFRRVRALESELHRLGEQLKNGSPRD